MRRLSGNNEKSYYASIRKQKKPWFNLRIKLTLFVTLELLFSIALAYAVDFIINDILLNILNRYIFSRFLRLCRKHKHQKQQKRLMQLHLRL